MIDPEEAKTLIYITRNPRSHNLCICFVSEEEPGQWFYKPVAEFYSAQDGLRFCAWMKDVMREDLSPGDTDMAIFDSQEELERLWKAQEEVKKNFKQLIERGPEVTEKRKRRWFWKR